MEIYAKPAQQVRGGLHRLPGHELHPRHADRGQRHALRRGQRPPDQGARREHAAPEALQGPGGRRSASAPRICASAPRSDSSDLAFDAVVEVVEPLGSEILLTHGSGAAVRRPRRALASRRSPTRRSAWPSCPTASTSSTPRRSGHQVGRTGLAGWTAGPGSLTTPGPEDRSDPALRYKEVTQDRARVPSRTARPDDSRPNGGPPWIRPPPQHRPSSLPPHRRRHHGRDGFLARPRRPPPSRRSAS